MATLKLVLLPRVMVAVPDNTAAGEGWFTVTVQVPVDTVGVVVQVPSLAYLL